jgi:hypothetical protein
MDHVTKTRNNAPALMDHEPETENNAPSSMDYVPKTKNNAPVSMEHVPETRKNALASMNHVPKTENNTPTVNTNKKPLAQSKGHYKFIQLHTSHVFVFAILYRVHIHHSAFLYR